MPRADDAGNPPYCPPGGARGGTVSLPDPAVVVVVGGGPAGSFFAIRLLRRARQSGRSVRVIILEKKTEVCFYQPDGLLLPGRAATTAPAVSPPAGRHPRAAKGSRLPEEIVESRADEVVVHGDWKSVRLPVPEGREMLSVFRGSTTATASRPLQQLRQRSCSTRRSTKGPEMITAEVDQRPLLGFRQTGDRLSRRRCGRRHPRRDDRGGLRGRSRAE